VALAAAPVSAGQPPVCAAGLASQLASTGDASQLLTVLAATAQSTTGVLTLWERTNGCWQESGGPYRVYLGRAGISDDHHEGDGTTPAGSYAIGPTLYGVDPDPHYHYPYRRIGCGDWWDENSASPGYNTLRHLPCRATSALGASSEALWRSTRAYAHFAFIEYNTDPIVPGRGSAIFLHADLGHPTTGCVSLPLQQLDEVLAWLRPAAHPRVVIGTAARILEY
jgi:L,D-peptidoglycan transpeptidase YkuD (ErfK/YbiS/YcfS/YnhG family)